MGIRHRRARRRGPRSLCLWRLGYRCNICRRSGPRRCDRLRCRRGFRRKFRRRGLGRCGGARRGGLRRPRRGDGLCLIGLGGRGGCRRRRIGGLRIRNRRAAGFLRRIRRRPDRSFGAVAQGAIGVPSEAAGDKHQQSKQAQEHRQAAMATRGRLPRVRWARRIRSGRRRQGRGTRRPGFSSRSIDRGGRRRGRPAVGAETLGVGQLAAAIRTGHLEAEYNRSLRALGAVRRWFGPAARAAGRARRNAPGRRADRPDRSAARAALRGAGRRPCRLRE